MRESMIRMREGKQPLGELVVELQSWRVEIGRYASTVADAAFELDIERTLLARIGEACLQGCVPGYGSRLVLEHAPLDDTRWRLSDGTEVDLFEAPELFVKARILERARAACRDHLASLSRPEARHAAG